MTAPRAVVAGLGKTGHSVVRYLLAQGWQITATDSRSRPPEIETLQQTVPGLRVALGGLDIALLSDVDYVVASPGLPQEDPFFVTARSLGVPIIGDIELFARSRVRPVVGITGTNGKSTVTTLVAHMASAAGLTARAGGNLGPPALDLLADAPAGVYVLELSSYQLETTRSLELVAATVLNVTPDHLDRYIDVQAYAEAKRRIFDRAAVAVINLDDPLVAGMVRGGQKALGFSLQTDRGADYYLAWRGTTQWLCHQGEPLLPVDQMRIVGRHNAANALAALALGEALGLARDAMIAALQTYAGLPHRTAWVADVNGVRYVNDSKGTNVGATLAAVEGFTGPLLLIVGGDGKNQDFKPLRDAFSGKVRLALLIGKDAAELEAALHGACALQRCTTLEEAVVAAARAARPGDTVLLSPACASLDMFRDYTHRGDVFADSVRRLAA